MINGLTYVPDFVTLDEQAELMRVIDQQEWSDALKRRTQHYGYRYDYTRKTIDTSMYLGPLPEWIMPIANKLVEQELFSELPDQVIVNEYEPGQGISRHIDCTTCFTSTIASLSLNSTVQMDFENRFSDKKGSIMLDLRSLLVLADEARYDWLHSIAPRTVDTFRETVFKRDRRVSLTFRKVIL